MMHHADLLDAAWWQEKQKRVREGILDDVFPYPDTLRFRHRLGTAPRAPRPA
jgi:isocitrate dehydrogenase kinase/phosphatase